MVKQRIGATVVAMLLVAGWAVPALSQDWAAGRPARIHAGACDDLGDVVAELDNLTVPRGSTVGQAFALVGEVSASSVPLPLDELLAADHALDVRQPDGLAVVCGEIGGVLATDGSLVFGLRERSGSGFTGVAYLAPDDDETTVSVFIAAPVRPDRLAPRGDDWRG